MLLLPLVAAAVFPFDRVLAGMVAAGQGIEAICLYLGLSRAALDGALVRLGLRTPHNRPLRKPGPRGWSVLDTMRLIVWRVAGVHPETIGLRLGRSAAAVRAKARRLGIPVPARKLLRRVDPATLVDPVPGFASPAIASAGSSQRPAAPSDKCGTAAGPVETGRRAPARVVDPHPAQSEGSERALPPPAASSTVGKAGRRVGGQREFQLFRVIPSSNPTESSPFVSAPPPAEPAVARRQASAARPSWEPALSGQQADLPSAEAARSADDLSWIGRLRNLPRNKEAVMLASLRYFGRQSYKHAAQQLGMTVAALRSLYDRIDLPRDYDRSKFGAQYDEERARENLGNCEYELVLCARTRRWWWRHKVTERFQRVSAEGARLRGSPRERGFEPRRVCV